MDVSQTCFACRKPHDQMLMMSCVHDLCINCAACAFAEHVHVKGLDPHKFICEFCSQETQLDSSTTAELDSRSRAFVKIPSGSKAGAKSDPSRGRNLGTSASPLNKKKDNSTTSAKKLTYFCRQHSEEQISYYCFSCCANICPECAIHGKHKDHDVKLIKKAISQVKASYEAIISNVSAQQAFMTKQKQNFLRLVREANEKTQQDKGLIIRQFDTLRANIAQKEKQLIKAVEEINKANIQMITNFLQSISLNYEEATKIKKSIQQILRKDEVIIFDEYSKVGDLESRINMLKLKSQDIKGEMQFIDAEFIQKQAAKVCTLIGQLKQQIVHEPVGAPASNYSSRLKDKQSEAGRLT